MSQSRPNILIISGSLRAGSSTDAVISAVISYAAIVANITRYDNIGILPHFNDNPDPPKEVIDFRNMLTAADGILICTPEYAFGVPGSLKNALDWTVSSGELVYKPVGLITAATGGDKAHASLLLTLTALSANVADESKLLIAFIRAKMGDGLIKDERTLKAIHGVVDALIGTIMTNENQ